MKRAEHRFGASAPLSLGVEEELLLVDEDGELVHAAEDVLESVPAPFAGRVSSEIFTEQIELKTGICDGAEAALSELEETRAAILEAGFGLLGCGLHPSARSGEAILVAQPRYEVVQKDLGSLLRTPPCGLHVHVGMPDPETAVHLTNAFRFYLPALQALSANSPFQEGLDSGHASARTMVVGSYPRFQVPREFRGYADFLDVADQLSAAAGVDDYTYIWWDVRPHPRLGTVEVRAVDVQTDVTASAAIAALIQAIAAKEIEEPTASRLHREALEESYFQAARHGLEAEILLDDETPRPAREVARRMLDSVRPFARELGSEDALGEIERILREGNGADDQRRVHSKFGLKNLLPYLLERTRRGGQAFSQLRSGQPGSMEIVEQRQGPDR
ncbi:MAG: glutamate---cysteine ligase / carboxylate-amine ligase [Solirubrobacterales bacterium]|nr:glutamate---cysteine ligase / carboxylate-amine ligase [Solirubrobacterales bacterium]